MPQYIYFVRVFGLVEVASAGTEMPYTHNYVDEGRPNANILHKIREGRRERERERERESERERQRARVRE